MDSFENKRVRTNDLTGYLVPFTINEEDYLFYGSLDNDIKERLTSHLKLTNTTNKDSRTLFITDNTKYQIICAVGFEKNTVISTRKVGATAYKIFDGLKVSKMIVPVNELTKELTEGAVLASFSFDCLKKEKKEVLEIISEKECQGFEEGKQIGINQNFARFLGETPANFMTPTIFANQIKSFFKNTKNVEILEYNKDFVEEKKMGLFLSVSQGSDEPLKFLHLKYKGKKEDVLDLALVGKGVTFDSGGISIKPSSKMGDMKLDMMGAATVASVLDLISKMNLKINVECFIPLTENLPSGKATKPGDVHISMKGISVEIENTDAEGRLILADALTYAQTFKPKHVINVATLTGAIVVALGSVYSGLFSNSDDFANLILESGNETGDLCWRMPLDERYKSSLDSIEADMKNCGDRKGGSCVAAIFLNEFIDKDVKWAHLDIAGSMNESCFSELYGKGATGVPLKLLYDIAKKLSLNQ